MGSLDFATRSTTSARIDPFVCFAIVLEHAFLRPGEELAERIIRYGLSLAEFI